MYEPQEIRFLSLGWEDPFEKGMATHFSVLPWRIRGQRSLAGFRPQGRKESDTTQATQQSVSKIQAYFPNFVYNEGRLKFIESDTLDGRWKCQST